MDEPDLARPADALDPPSGETPIAALPFRLRTLNALRTAGVETVEALCRLAPDDPPLRGLSDVVARDVEAVLAAHALALSAPRDDGETPVATLGLSARAANALQAAGVETVETLCLLRPVDLSRVPQLGLQGALEVAAALTDRGLSLRAGGQAPSIDKKATAFVAALGGRPAADEAPSEHPPFPVPADVAAVLAAAARDGVAHTAAGEHLRYVARRLAELVLPAGGAQP